MSGNIVAFKHQAPQAFGSNDEINAIIERMERLLPVEAPTTSDARKNLNDAYVKAAQLSVFYRLIPGTDVHIIRFGKNFAVDVGVEAWKKAADRYCARMGLTYHAVYEELSEDEVKRLRGNLYTNEDVGFVCYLMRSDKTEFYKMFGGKDAMTKGYGTWAKKAKQVNGTWQADQLPSQRSKFDVARRRALKAALKAEFSLDSLLEAAPNEIRQQMQWLDASAQAVERDHAIIQPKRQVDDEGLWLITDVPDPSPSEPTDPFVDDTWEEGDFVASHEEPEPIADDAKEAITYNGVDYRSIAERLTDDANTLHEWALTYHADSNGPADLLDYRILAGDIDRIIGEDGHKLLLSVLLCRPTSSANVPGERFVRFLRAFIEAKRPVMNEDGSAVKDEKGKTVKEDNPQFRQPFVDAIVETWRQIREIAG